MELLAPSDKNTFFQAINNGADAVYIGLKDFSARYSADNISLEDLDYYLSYAHLFGVKVYCAVNTLVKDEEISNYFNLILSAYNKGVDAFIMQDIFLGKFLLEKYPFLTLHLSTQAGINNLYGAKLAKQYGFSRVILARETSLEEIEEIAKVIETEIFVHGALCSSFSGHCYYSSYIGGNSGNRGRCKQPCRQKFSYNGSFSGDYALSLSDLRLCDYIQKIKDLGVSSVKIEGRMRSGEYVAKAVSLYRKAIDGDNYSVDKLELSKIYNRGDYTTGYFIKDNNVLSDKIQSHKGSYYTSVNKILGKNLICDKKANEGDCFKILRDEIEIGNATYLKNAYIFKGQAKIGDKLYITKDVELNKRVLKPKKLKELDLILSVEGDFLKIKCEQTNLEYISESIVQPALKTPTTQDDILQCFNKTDIYPFKINLKFKDKLQNIFIPKGLLNSFRRDVFFNIFLKYQNKKDIKILDNITDFSNNYIKENNKAVIVSSVKQLSLNADIFVIFPNNYNCLSDIVNSQEFINCKKDKYLFIPSFLNNKDLIIEKYLQYFNGLYADGLSGIYLAEKYNKKLFIGLGLNIFNSLTYKVVKNLYPDCLVVLSKELDKSINIENAYIFTKGYISIMEFIYCPFKNNCSKCDKKHYYIGKDQYEDFILRRFQLSSCRFELYPKKILNIKKDGNELINLVNCDNEYNLDNFTINKPKTNAFIKSVE